MTKPITGFPARFARIPLDQLVPSPNNPRKHFDQAKLEELGRSLASAAGQHVPILVREMAGMAPYEILDGERRYRAATIAKLPDLECKVISCSDAEALEITVIANLQREDITPLEEANGVASLLAAGRPVEEIAKDLGKSVGWVYLRAKLTDLSPAWRKAVSDPHSDVYGWPASKLELIARFPEAQQNEMLEEWDIIEAPNVKELAKVLDRHFLRSLTSAPWSLDDEKLVPKAGACRACPKRTSCQQNLFAVSKDDRCTDGVCWAAKDAAHLAQIEKTLAEKHPKLLKLDKKTYHSQDKGVVGYGQVQTTTKSDPKAVAALIVNGPGKGSIAYVKPGSSNQGISNPTGRPTGPVPEQERLEQKLRQRRALAVEIVKHLLQGRNRLTGDAAEVFGTAKITEMGFGTVRRPARKTLVALAAALGLERDWKTFELEAEPLDEETWANVRAHAELPDADLDERLWQRIVLQICEMGQLQSDDDIEPVCELVGLKASAIVAAVALAKPLPRTLAATYHEDGTKRTGVVAEGATKPPTGAGKPAKASKPAKAKPTAKAKPKRSAKAKKGKAAVA